MNLVAWSVIHRSSEPVAGNADRQNCLPKELMFNPLIRGNHTKGGGLELEGMHEAPFHREIHFRLFDKALLEAFGAGTPYKMQEP